MYSLFWCAWFQCLNYEASLSMTVCPHLLVNMRLKKWLAAASTTLWAARCLPWTTRVTSHRVPWRRHTHTQLHTTTHRSSLRCTSSLTHLFPQVVHDSHDAGQLSVLLFSGTLPLALLLGACRLLRRDHPRHVGPRFSSADRTTLPAPLPAVCSAALCCR